MIVSGCHAMHAERLARMAWVGLLVLALGAASHLRHHLVDPDCENHTHACAVCAAFHGGVLAGHGEVAAAPPPGAPLRLAAAPTDREPVHASPVGPTRGPPAA